MQSDYAWPTLIFGALAALSIAVDWLRHKRKGEPGEPLPVWALLPWPLVAMLALIVTAVSGALWMRGD